MNHSPTLRTATKTVSQEFPNAASHPELRKPTDMQMDYSALEERVARFYGYSTGTDKLDRG